MNQHLHPASPTPVLRSPSAGYRFVVADDEIAWPAGEGPGGLLRVGERAQIDGFDRLTADGRALVVVCGAHEAAAVHRASAIARSQAQARVAVVPVPLGPLGQDVLAAIGKELVAGGSPLPAAELISWLPRAAELILDLALVSGVSQLDLPGVVLRHHLLSYLPGRRVFVAQVAPVTAVARITRAGQLRPEASLHRPTFDDTYGITIAAAGPRPLPEVVLQCCRSSSVPPRLPSSAALTSFWRDADATEVVVAPAAVTRWANDLLPAVAIVPCSWCDEPLASTATQCVFCGNVVH